MISGVNKGKYFLLDVKQFAFSSDILRFHYIQDALDFKFISHHCQNIIGLGYLFYFWSNSSTLLFGSSPN